MDERELGHRGLQAPWMEIALRDMGACVHEIAGPDAHPRILEALAQTGLRDTHAAQSDETAWCGAYVNLVLGECGIEGTGSAMARSWLRWGIALSRPAYGAITVLWRGSPSSGHGHVAFYVRPGPRMPSGERTLQLLGGNQRNAVRLANYPEYRVLGYRLPVPEVLCKNCGATRFLCANALGACCTHCDHSA